jgi:hypothetical protein
MNMEVVPWENLHESNTKGFSLLGRINQETSVKAGSKQSWFLAWLIL